MAIGHAVPRRYDRILPVATPRGPPMPLPRSFRLLLVVGIGILLAAPAARGEEGEAVVAADFTRPGHGWRPKGATLRPAAEGVVLEATEEDPWILGPATDVPAAAGGDRLLVELAAEAPAAFRCYVAAERGDFSEATAAALEPAGPGLFVGLVPALGPRMRFRLDPPDGAPVTLRSMRVRALTPLFTLPTRPADAAAPVPPAIGDDALEATGGMVSVRHDRRRWNRFEVRVGGTRMADALPEEVFWTTDGRRPVSLDPNAGRVTVTTLAQGFEVVASVREEGDPADAATWTFTRRVERADRGVRVETGIEADRRRVVVHLPWLTLLAGLGSFGTHKSQALLPGVEYLADEPSSGEREIRGPAANRRLVDPLDVCFPTLVLAAEKRWLAVDLVAGGPPTSPVFDSPDRILASGGHLLGFWSPAAGGAGAPPSRFPGDLAVHRGVVVEPGKALRVAVTLRGGFGDTVLRAVAEHVREGGLPAVPEVPGGLDHACRLLAHGWLDSAARDGTAVRHAVWPGQFAPQPAADAPACMLWLAAHVADARLADRLRASAAATFAALPAAATGGVGHVVRPSLPLLVRRDVEGLAAAVDAAGARARRIAAEIVAGGGRVRYEPGATDYGSTLGDADPNGVTAIAAEAMLDAAALSGDEATIRGCLEALDLVARAAPAGAVPRGAQGWEMPLHTPDILAAARMTRVHLLGFLLDGHPRRLDAARAWAWSGVPFVYLRDPVPGAAVGRYATIGVLGATNWEAPLWIGRPVQWCGLVYAAALQDLARVDVPLGDTWRELGRGITRAGLLMTFPADDPAGRGGLLPDYWLFRSGRGDGPAINPGTLQATLAEAFDGVPLVTATRLPGTAGHGGHVVHVAGRVESTTVSDGAAAIDLVAWQESLVLVTRVARPPARVAWNGAPVAVRRLDDGSLAVPVSGRGTLTVEW